MENSTNFIVSSFKYFNLIIMLFTFNYLIIKSFAFINYLIIKSFAFINYLIIKSFAFIDLTVKSFTFMGSFIKN